MEKKNHSRLREKAETTYVTDKPITPQGRSPARELLRGFLKTATAIGGFQNVAYIIHHGSSAEGRALPESDIDLCIYYKGTPEEQAARKAKNWKEADEIRAQLKAMGIVLEDTAQGVRWHKEKV